MSDLAGQRVEVAAVMRTERYAGGAVLLQTARRAVRSGALWGWLFGVLVASSAISYTTIYKTEADRKRLAAAFESNKATAALFGPAHDLQTVAGFTAFKISMTILVLGALWGLFTSTKLLRGEEDAGRWELMLTGRTTPLRATNQAVLGLGAGIGTLWIVTALICVVIGQSSRVDISPPRMLYFSLALATTALMFVAIGSLTSQLAPTRRQASALAGWVLGASYALRMVADAGVGLHGLIWVTPLGWAEELQPFDAPRPLALIPILCFTIAVCAVAVRLSQVRDVGSGTMADRTRAPARTRLLSGPLGLSVRTLRPTVLAWMSAFAITGLVLGLVARQAGTTLSGSSVKAVFSRLGASGTGAEAFLGVAFLIIAVLAAFMTVGQLAAARTEEAEGRLERVIVEPFRRSSWLAGRLVIALTALLCCGVVSGVLTWLGAASQSSGVGLDTLVEAGVNVVPPSLCLLGIGVLAFGTVPRATSYIAYGILGWSLLVELVGGIDGGAADRWLLDTSLFHQMAAAPAANPNWTVNAVMIAIGAGAAVVGGAWFSRRDLEGA